MIDLRIFVLSRAKKQRTTLQVKGKFMLSELQAKEKSLNSSIQWRAGLVLGSIVFLISMYGCYLLAIQLGWMPKHYSFTYITFNAPVRLDGVDFNTGDFLKVEQLYGMTICLRHSRGTKCYPRKWVINSGFREQSVPIDRVGRFDYELRTPIHTIKASENFTLGNYNIKKGDIITNIVTDVTQGRIVP